MADTTFTIDIDSSTATASLNTLDAGFKKVTASGDKAADTMDNVGKATTKAGGAFSMLESGLKNIGKPLDFAISGLGNLKFLALGAAEAFVRLSDEITKFQSFISMMTVTVGTVAAARGEFEYLLGVANRLGVPVDALTKNFGQFQAAVKGSAIEGDKARYVFESFATMTRALHLTTHDTTLVFYALTQMMSKGVVSMEELRRQLGEKMPGAMNLAARAVNTTMTELEGAIRKGTVDSGKLLYAMSQQIMREYSIPATIASQALDAELNRVHNTLKSVIVTFYDLGVAASFSEVLKELNRIIADPAIAKVFSEILKDLAGNLTAFLKQIDANFISSTMKSFKEGFGIGVDVLRSLFGVVKDLLPHFAELVRLALIMKGVELGSSIGQAAGAAIGAVATPEFLGLGAIPGALIGSGAGGLIGGASMYYATRDMGKGYKPTSEHGASGSWDNGLPGNEPINNMPPGLLNKMSREDVLSVNAQMKAVQFYNDYGKANQAKDYGDAKNYKPSKIEEASYAAASLIQKNMNSTLAKYDKQTYGQSTSLGDVLGGGGKADTSPAAQFMDQLARMEASAKADDSLAGLGTKLEQLRVKDPKNMTDARYGTALATIDGLKTKKDGDLLRDMTSEIEKSILDLTTPKTESQGFVEGLKNRLVKAGASPELLKMLQPLLDKRDAAAENNFNVKMGSKIEGSLNKISELTKQYDMQYDAVGKTADEQTRTTTMLSIQKQIMTDSLSLRKDYEAQNKSKDDTDAAIAAFTARANLEADAAINALARVQAYQKSMLGGALRAFSSYSDSISDIGGSIERVMIKGFKGMEDALTNFVMTGKLSFKGLANSIIADMARIAVQQSITGPLFKLLSMMLPAIGGTGAIGPAQGSVVANTATTYSTPITLNAKGNVINSPGLSAYTNSIVSSPTIFPFAKGGNLGLMGEAGSEAIMPLSRDSNGSLGVKAQIKKDANSDQEAPEIVINIINNGQPMKAKQQGGPSIDSFGRMVITVIADAMDTDPNFRSMMSAR